MERRRISLEDEIIFTRSQARRPTGCVAGTSKVGAVTGGRGGRLKNEGRKIVATTKKQL